MLWEQVLPRQGDNMRRRMIVLTAATLFVVLAAAPGIAEPDKELPEPVDFVGSVHYGAIEARTGEYAGDTVPPPLAAGPWGSVGWEQLMDPAFNYCNVEGTLTWTDKNTALLETVETCPPWRVIFGPTEHHKVVHITKGGAIKMTPSPDYPTNWQKLPEWTGCDLNGTFPVYHGYFDGEHLYASAHYNSLCDGGTRWVKFGIGLEDGPIHITYYFDLDVVDS